MTRRLPGFRGVGRRRVPRPVRAARNLTYRVAVLATQMERLEADVRGLREQVETQRRQADDVLQEVISAVDRSSGLIDDKLSSLMARAQAVAELGISIVPLPPTEAPSADEVPASEVTSIRTCVVCERSVDAWLPFRGGDAAWPIFLKKVHSVGSILRRFWCPHCYSTDRERHLRLFIDQLNLMEHVRGGAALHMSPEPGLGRYIESHGLELYVRGDLTPTAEGVQQIDLQQIPYPAETFDLVIANHMLEHVESTEIALREMHRVLKHGGRAICQTPYAARLTKTFEEPLLQSPDDRFFFYGQEDHLRLFGADITEHFIAAGFVGRLVPHSEILPDIDPEQFGVNEREPFFDFVRP